MPLAGSYPGVYIVVAALRDWLKLDLDAVFQSEPRVSDLYMCVYDVLASISTPAR